MTSYVLPRVGLHCLQHRITTNCEYTEYSLYYYLTVTPRAHTHMKLFRRPICYIQTHAIQKMVRMTSRDLQRLLLQLCSIPVYRIPVTLFGCRERLCYMDSSYGNLSRCLKRV